MMKSLFRLILFATLLCDLAANTVFAGEMTIPSRKLTQPKGESTIPSAKAMLEGESQIPPFVDNRGQSPQKL